MFVHGLDAFFQEIFGLLEIGVELLAATDIGISWFASGRPTFAVTIGCRTNKVSIFVDIVKKIIELIEIKAFEYAAECIAES